MESEGVFDGAQKAGMEGEGEMEVVEQEDRDAEVQDSAQQLLRSEVSVSVHTAQQDAQDSELEEKDEQKKK